MAFTQKQLEAMEKALASGVSEVSYDGKTMKYRSVDELEKAISRVRAELKKSSGGQRRRVLRLSSSRGL
tara:strand:+ start:1558 stop:1764 length:207 start_codon:yes stop_codon:yes gene_type:complete